MREYELHKQELLLQIQLYNRQTQYIQIYAAFLLGLLAFFSGTSPDWLRPLTNTEQSSTPQPETKHLDSEEDGTEKHGIKKNKSEENKKVPIRVSAALLSLAAIIAFYLVSAVMSSSYMFLIIRRRMALIEKQLNILLRYPDLLVYESRVTPHFLEKSRYGIGWLTITPHSLSAVWRIALFGTIIFILCIMALSLINNSIIGIVYSIVIVSISLIQIFLYYRMNNKDKKYFEDFYKC